MAKRVNILFGAVDIGWRIAHYSHFIKNTPKQPTLIRSFVKHKVRKEQYLTNYDFEFQFENHPKVVQWIISFAFFIFALVKFDTFYFFSGETILTRKLMNVELWIYRLFNKRVVMHFVGSDIRDPQLILWKEKNIKGYLSGKLQAPSLSNEWQLSLIKKAKKYADYLMVSSPDLLSILPSANYFPVLIDEAKFYADFNSHTSEEYAYFKTDKIKILHAPSNVQLKGSNLIVEELRKLEKIDDRIEFIYTVDLKRDTGTVYSVSRYELFQLYKEADIVIDQLTIGWYGLQTIESILSDCIALCYIEKSLLKYTSSACPIIATDANNLVKDIQKAVSLFETKQYNYENAKKWVKAEHTISERNTELLEALNFSH